MLEGKLTVSFQFNFNAFVEIVFVSPKLIAKTREKQQALSEKQNQPALWLLITQNEIISASFDKVWGINGKKNQRRDA